MSACDMESLALTASFEWRNLHSGSVNVHYVSDQAVWMRAMSVNSNLSQHVVEHGSIMSDGSFITNDAHKKQANQTQVCRQRMLKLATETRYMQ